MAANDALVDRQLNAALVRDVAYSASPRPMIFLPANHAAAICTRMHSPHRSARLVSPSYAAIAVQANVSRATVSRVLRNDPRISKNTAARVLDAARSLGYRPNPLLAALMEQVRTGKQISYVGRLAVVTDAETPTQWYGTANSWESIHRGVVRRSQENGYELEFFNARKYGRSGRRLSQVLRSRGIHGVYVAPGFKERRLDLDWSAFSAATTGYSLIDPPLHRVCYNNYHGIQLACKRLHELGYRRIGLYLEKRDDEVTDHNYLAGYLLFMESAPVDHHIPPVLVRKYDRRSFLSWIKRTRPDALISNTPQLLEWARETGVNCPDEFGFAHLDQHGRLSGCAGINHNSEVIGSAVVDLIIAQLQRGELGLPKHALTTIVEGHWVNGRTVRSPEKKKQKRAAKS